MNVRGKIRGGDFIGYILSFNCKLPFLLRSDPSPSPEELSTVLSPLELPGLSTSISLADVSFSLTSGFGRPYCLGSLASSISMRKMSRPRSGVWYMTLCSYTSSESCFVQGWDVFCEVISPIKTYLVMNQRNVYWVPRCFTSTSGRGRWLDVVLSRIRYRLEDRRLRKGPLQRQSFEHTTRSKERATQQRGEMLYNRWLREIRLMSRLLQTLCLK